MAAIVNEKATALETPALEGAARPDWRQQPHSWFLAGLVVANVALINLWFKAADDGAGILALAGYGMLLGQLFLMAIWLSYGGLPVAARFLAVAAAPTAGAAAFGVSVDSLADVAPLFALVGGTIVLVLYAALLPLRTLLGWRIDFDPAYHAHALRQPMQLRLSNILAYTAVCALPCALFQWFGHAELAPAALALGAFTASGCIPVAWLILSTRRTKRFWCVWAGMVLVAIALHPVLYQFELLPAEIGLGMQFGAVAAVALNLGLSRLLFNLRLFSVFDPPLAAAAHPAGVEAELAYLAIAWPQLPAAIRSALFDQIRAAAMRREEQSEPAAATALFAEEGVV